MTGSWSGLSEAGEATNLNLVHEKIAFKRDRSYIVHNWVRTLDTVKFYCFTLSISVAPLVASTCISPLSHFNPSPPQSLTPSRRSA